MLWILVFFSCFQASAATFINEILFDVPGIDDPREYIELRGAPNFILESGTYLVAVEGDLGGNPGIIQNLFELSDLALGGNGFLVLLQKGHSYAPTFGAAVLANSGTGPGFGDDDSSSIEHDGESGNTDLENPSVTFFLVRTAVEPSVGDDIDIDDNGSPDGAVYAAWTILDSVGVLDSDGVGDFAYGAINFRRGTAPGNGAGALGNVVSVGFTADYVGRTGNTTGSSAGDWVAGNDLGGSAPQWTLGSAGDTAPSSLANAALNHLGGPNFGAPLLSGVIVHQPGRVTSVSEGGAAVSYTLALSAIPSGGVTISLSADSGVEVSIDGGASFGTSRMVTLSSTTARTVLVRAPENNLIDTTPHVRVITHAVTSTGDNARYPLTTVVPPVKARVMENDWALLNELKVNPPGTDEPFEFVELRGPANALLTNVYFLGIEGNAASDPGTANVVVNLSGRRLGSNGLLVLVGAGHPYRIPTSSTTVVAPQLATVGGALGNGTISFLLVSSPESITQGDDLDRGDNGIMERLPFGATIMDAVGWNDGNTNDIVYGPVSLSQTTGTPDAAARFPDSDDPNSADAWFNGDLSGFNGDSIVYDENNVGPDFPFGTVMTPGMMNNTAPVISPIAPLSGVIGDPTNPEVSFLVNDDETPPESITVLASSNRPDIVPDGNITVIPHGSGIYSIRLNPIGVGYATITVVAGDGTMTWATTFPYAASAAATPATRWHVEISDASGAIPIDDTYMFVADDENQTIRIYFRHLSGPPVGRFNFTPFLGLTDIEMGIPREVDIEGVTRVGNRLFWIGSHSHANISEVRTNRSRIFATDLSGTSAGSALTYVGRYEHFKTDLVVWDNLNGHGRGARHYGFELSASEGTDPKSTAGLNIEGLAMAPGSSTTAYIAFRAPTAPATNRQYALIIPVLNFTALAVSDGPPGSTIFGTPIELDLFGRGIRSIEGNGDGYLIVGGGSIDNAFPYPNDFRLYTWTGQPGDRPQERGANLAGLNPEAIVQLPPGPWTADSDVQLLSDNGRTIYYNDDTIAKKLTVPNFKKFRSDVVKLGPVVNPRPVIVRTEWTAPGVLITWRAVSGSTYRVQYKDALANPLWTDLPGNVTASGPLASRLDSSPSSLQRYYHLVTVP